MQVLIVLSILCIVLSVLSIVVTGLQRSYTDEKIENMKKRLSKYEQIALDDKLIKQEHDSIERRHFDDGQRHTNQRLAKLEKIVHERLMTDIIKTGDDVTLRYDSQDKWKVVGVSTDVDDAAQE